MLYTKAMKRFGLVLALPLALSAQALTLQGTVMGGAGLGPQPRVGLWLLGEGGAATGKELVSAPIVEGKFSLALPAVSPPAAPLRPDNVNWPGVIGSVHLSANVPSSDAALFVYGDPNGNGQRDSAEPLRDTFPDVARQPLFVVWVASAVQVSAGKGFEAQLRPGWNVLTVELGRNAQVSPYAGQSINLRVP